MNPGGDGSGHAVERSVNEIGIQLDSAESDRISGQAERAAEAGECIGQSHDAGGVEISVRCVEISLIGIDIKCSFRIGIVN